MNKRHKKLLSELKKIAAHFRLKLSKIDIVKKTAIALDTSNKKLLVIDENKRPFFKTIDLNNINACTVKVDYGRINAGDLPEKNMDDFVEKIQLQISHIDPGKSVDIGFYNTKHDNAHDLKLLTDKATDWRDKISAILAPRLQARA